MIRQKEKVGLAVQVFRAIELLEMVALHLDGSHKIEDEEYTEVINELCHLLNKTNTQMRKY